MSLELVTGDDEKYGVTLRKRDAAGDLNTFAIADTATVTAAVISKRHKDLLIPDTVQSKNEQGADWAASLVVVIFPAALTGAIEKDGAAVLKVRVDDNGKSSWFGDMDIKLGETA